MYNSMKTFFTGAKVSTQPVVPGEAIRAQGNTSQSGALDQHSGTSTQGLWQQGVEMPQIHHSIWAWHGVMDAPSGIFFF